MEQLHSRSWVDFSSSQGLVKCWSVIPTGSTWASLGFSPRITGHGWIRGSDVAQAGMGMWHRKYSARLKPTHSLPTSRTLCRRLSHHLRALSFPQAAVFPTDLTLTPTAAPDTHANKSFVSHAESTFLIAHFTLLITYPHQLKRCNCSQVPPPIQRFPWSSLTFVL